LNLSHKLKFSNSYLCATWWWKPQILWSNIIHSLKYLRSVILGCKDIGIIKSDVYGSIPLLTFRGNYIFSFFPEDKKISQISFFLRFVPGSSKFVAGIYSVMLGNRGSLESIFNLIYIFLVNFSSWGCLLIYFS